MTSRRPSATGRSGPWRRGSKGSSWREGPQLPALVADAPALDFLNATASTAGAPCGAVATGEDLVAWLVKAGLVDSVDLDALRDSIDPSELDAVAARARALGEWFRNFVTAHRGRTLSAATLSELAPLNRFMESDVLGSQVEAEDGPGGQRLVWRHRRPWSSPDALILPLAQAMSRLVCEEDFSLVRVCEGSCGQLFLDRTRGRARRWCSMATCGNRAKQAAHKLRLASATARRSGDT